MPLPYKSPYNLRQIVNADPRTSATPGAAAEELVYNVAKENAEQEAGAQVAGRQHSLRETSVGLKEKALTEQGRQFDKTLELKGQQFGGKTDLESRKLNLAEQTANFQDEQRQRATVFAGVAAALNLGTGWWQSKKLENVIDKYTGRQNSLEETFKELNELIGTETKMSKSLIEELRKVREKKE